MTQISFAPLIPTNGWMVLCWYLNYIFSIESKVQNNFTCDIQWMFSYLHAKWSTQITVNKCKYQNANASGRNEAIYCSQVKLFHSQLIEYEIVYRMYACARGWKLSKHLPVSINADNHSYRSRCEAIEKEEHQLNMCQMLYLVIAHSSLQLCCVLCFNIYTEWRRPNKCNIIKWFAEEVDF